MFSIVIPTHNRADGRLQRALDSVVRQTWGNWQCIIVDDGSTDLTKQVVSTYKEWDLRWQYIRHDKRQERVVSRNDGMRAAKGDWIVWLDSDDALDPMYLAAFAHHIEQQPEARLWLCGAIFHGMVMELVDDRRKRKHICPRWTKLVKPYMPPLSEDPDEVHAHFDSGKATSGQFVFHRECLEKTGYMPPWRTPIEVANGINEWLGYRTGYSGARKEDGGKWVGNPWGEDHCMLRRLTQFYLLHKIDACLYIHYLRR
jgi:glycosyltransferase involved in cell wall biosynthesis